MRELYSVANYMNTMENGCGLKAANALSTKCIVTSCRDKNKKTIYFECGNRVKETDEKISNNEHGTTVSFIPDESILGKIKFEKDDIFDLCSTMAYLSKVNIKCTVITRNAKVITENYKYKKGIFDLIENISHKPICKPICISKEEKTMSADVAFIYDPENELLINDNNNNEFILSFANYCTTINGGTHVKGLKDGLSQCITKYTRENCLNKKELDTLNITGADARNGLVAVVNITVDNAQFLGQVKESLDNPEMVAFVKNVVIGGFKEWAKSHSGDAKRIGEYVKSMAKIRLNALKEKKHAVKENFANGFSGERPKNWSGKCTLYGKKDKDGNPYPIEIYIVEGESAGGSAKQARNKLYQEVYKLKGVPLNTVPRAYTLEGMSRALDELLKNDEFRGLKTIMNMGSSKNIDISKDPYAKYIIDTDSDIDGNRITSLLSAFFYFHCRPVVEAGKLYKVVAPLYKIEVGKGKNKKEIFFNDNTEYIEYIQQEISNKLEIEAKSNNEWHVLTKEDIVKLMVESSEYRRKIKKLSKHTVTNIVLLEKFVSNFKYLRNNDFDRFQKEIAKISKDLKVIRKDNNIIIRGLYEREMQLFRITNKLLSKTKVIEEYYNNLEWEKFRVNDKKMPLIELLELMYTYEPEHKQRFKGLGEMNARELGDTTMIPGKRKLIRLTTSDLEKEINQFLVLHSEGTKYREERKSLMSKFKISIDNIDG